MHLMYTFIVAVCLFLRSSDAFGLTVKRSCNYLPTSCAHHHQSKLYMSGGFGGGGSSKAKNKKKGKGDSKTASSKRMNPRDAKRAQQELVERYGGDLQLGTQKRIEASLESLQPHLREAAELYKAITQFDALVKPMTTADRNRLIPAVQSKMVDDDRQKLQSIMDEHKLTNIELHNIYQKITWDASADAKATGADIVGNQMKPEFQERINKACAIAIKAAGSNGSIGKVLDVGCGHGAIIKSLTNVGLEEPDMYVGIDLSSEMIDNAIKRYGAARNGKTGKGRTFIAEDFYSYDFEGTFDSVIFCSSLHDLPDMTGAISKASSLLRPNGGKLIVIHAQGAQHVLGQNQANPVMVKRGLPTSLEWAEMINGNSDWGLELECEPADPRSSLEEKEGYLAVLTKI